MKHALAQNSSSPGIGLYYAAAELAVSSLAVVLAVAGAHSAYSRRDGQAELALVVRFG